MRYCLTLAILCLTSFSVSAQNWAPIGAEWHYSHRNEVDTIETYTRYRATMDTLHEGVVCTLLEKINDVGCYRRPPFEFTFSRNDSVFFWDTTYHEFQMLYDFGAQPGDTWLIKQKRVFEAHDTVVATVDSIGNVMVNSIPLRKLFVTYRYWGDTLFDPYPPSSVILERIGDLHFLFDYYWDGYLLCDGDYTEGLRCYQDHVLGFYDTDLDPSCDWTTGISENYPESNSLWPTVSSTEIELRTSIPQGEVRYIIVDMNGQKISEGFISGSTQKVNISGLLPGMYLLRVAYGIGSSQVFKFIRSSD